MDLISTRLNSEMFIVRMTMRVIILAIRTCVDITALNGSCNMTYLALQPKNHWSWDKCSTKTWSNICNGQVIEKIWPLWHRGSISDGQIFLAFLSSLTLSYSSSSPPFDLKTQTWESGGFLNESFSIISI